MPQLDVSDVLLDPAIADVFDVTRRVQALTAKGRTTTSPSVFKNVRGVVTAAHGNDLERLDDSQRMGRNMSVVTKFALRGPAQVTGTKFQPDLVIWAGDTYVVKAVDPYERYGRGFVQAIIGSIDIIDAPSGA